MSIQGDILRQELTSIAGTSIFIEVCNATRESHDFAFELTSALRAAGLKPIISSDIVIGGMGAPLIIRVHAPHTKNAVAATPDALKALKLRESLIGARVIDSKDQILVDEPFPAASQPRPNIWIQIWPW